MHAVCLHRDLLLLKDDLKAQDILSPGCRRKKRAHLKHKQNIATAFKLDTV